jgi:hypothetical protein
VRAARSKPRDIETQLREDIASFQHDPAGFVFYAFPWGEPGPLQHKKPRRWFLKLCERISAKLRANGARTADGAWEVVQEAVASGHGIGKSAGMAQLILWAMSTFEKTRGVITANTFTQLTTKTWPELLKWHGMSINRHWFTATATSLYHVSDEKGWRVDAIPWSAHNTEAFAGLHNEGRRILIGMDEASGIADAVWETTEGALTDDKTEILWIAMGNPTRARGRFRDCFTKQRHLWGTANVDSRTVEGVNLDRIEKWRRLYGEQSQFFNVRVRGQFVEADANQLIALEWIAEARARGAAPIPDMGERPRLRVTVDVADGGEDDTVITVVRHHGPLKHVLKMLKFSFAPSVAPIESAEAAERLFHAWGGNAELDDDIVVDALGVGAGTAGTLMKRDMPVIAYKGGESASSGNYRNRRVQSYIGLRNDFRDGLIALDAAMFDDDEQWEEFEAQLCSVQSKPGVEKLEDLVTKEEMRRAGIKSPDHADSLAMQYATHSPSLNSAYTSPDQYAEAINASVTPLTWGAGYVR